MNRLNKTEPAVFLYCRLFLFLNDPFFPRFFCGMQTIIAQTSLRSEQSGERIFIRYVESMVSSLFTRGISGF